jgi:hypothetical protein
MVIERLMTDVPEPAQGRILCDNAAALYGIT